MLCAFGVGRTIYNQYFDVIGLFALVLASEIVQLCKAWHWDAQAPSQQSDGASTS